MAWWISIYCFVGNSTGFSSEIISKIGQYLTKLSPQEGDAFLRHSVSVIVTTMACIGLKLGPQISTLSGYSLGNIAIFIYFGILALKIDHSTPIFGVKGSSDIFLSDPSF